MGSPVVIDKETCLNFNYKKMACRKCRQACPLNCIGEDLTVDAAVCNECGLCLAACPAEAVAGVNFTNRALQSLAGGKAVMLACRKREAESSWPCLGFLPAFLLAAWGLDGRQVVVDTLACGACNPAVADHLRRSISGANTVLAVYKKPLIMQSPAESRQQQESLSRRAFFGRLFGAAVETVREVALPSDGTAERLTCRDLADAMLLSMPPASLSQATDVLHGITITTACQACGLCGKFCTRRAITLADRTDELDIFHDPLRCTGCGVCAAHCPADAITVGAAAELGRHMVFSARLPRCPACHELFQPVNNQPVCLECMLKGRRQTLF